MEIVMKPAGIYEIGERIKSADAARSCNLINRATKNLGLSISYLHDYQNSRLDDASYENDKRIIDSVCMNYGINVGDLRESVKRRKIIDWQLGDPEPLSLHTAQILMQVMERDKHALYEIKDKVLYVADIEGELVYQEPECDGDQYYNSVQWHGYQFHYPYTMRQEIEKVCYEKEIKNMDKKRKYGVICREAMCEAIWLLTDYLSQHGFDAETYRIWRGDL